MILLIFAIVFKILNIFVLFLVEQSLLANEAFQVWQMGYLT